MEEVAINPTIELPDFTQDWEMDFVRAQQNFVHQDPGERISDSTEDCPGIACVCPGVPAKAWVSGSLQGWKH